MNHQQKKHRLRTDTSLSHRVGGLNVFYWCQIFAPDSVVVKAYKLFGLKNILFDQ